MRGTRPTGRRCAAENALTEIMSHRILLVDDEPDILEFVKYTLVKEGYEVFTAQNGAEALKAAAQHRPHLILLDMMMPVMDGLEAARRIRSLNRPDAKTIPIFAMTANAFADDAERSRQAGMNEHLTKPLDAQVLLKTIGKYRKQGK